uniref:Uncharacterized protein n=1 Tax=Panagrolaimus sp. ES5 TaxID=591445 RepID=A0AC34FI72_9BILA
MIGLFVDDEKEKLEIVASNIDFYVPEQYRTDAINYVISFSGTTNYLYYFLAIFALKDLAAMILNLWFLLIFCKFMKYLYDLKNDLFNDQIIVESDKDFKLDMKM